MMACKRAAHVRLRPGLAARTELGGGRVGGRSSHAPAARALPAHTRTVYEISAPDVSKLNLQRSVLDEMR